MAENTATKTAPRKPAVKKQEETPVEQRKIVPKDIDPNQYVPVRNGFRGRLIYISPRTGERFDWSEFGDMQEMELRELQNAKSSKKKFFQNNWFMLDDWVVDYLGVRQYYKNSVPIDEFDDLFKKSPSEIKKILSKVPDGQKRSIAYRARELIRDNKIDSLSVISALEESLGVELIEK